MSRSSDSTESFLRLRACVSSGCGAIFTICVSCDRGQRYCSEQCRATKRRRQRAAANSRYQQSEGGRECHRRSQQRYRDQKSETVMVTDQGSESIISPVPSVRAPVCTCRICGKVSRWINPYPAVQRSLEASRKSNIRQTH